MGWKTHDGTIHPSPGHQAKVASEVYAIKESILAPQKMLIMLFMVQKSSHQYLLGTAR